MIIQAEHELAKIGSIFSSPVSSKDETIYLTDRRKEELDLVDIPVPDEEEPDEENIDPQKIEPTGTYGDTESRSKVDGTDSEPDPDSVDDSEADEDDQEKSISSIR